MPMTGIALFNVRDFGAKGDGSTLDTEAIRRAMDASAKAGGGRVYFPPGCYFIGSFELKSNCSLYLERGARLLASTDRSLYPAVDIRGAKPNTVNYGEEHLIWARGAENIAIEGPGTIDGNGKNFFGPLVPGSNFLSIQDWRPWQLIAFIECKNVRMTEVSIVDAPGWTIWPFACDQVFIRGIRILNNRRGPNTDGIDPDCSRGVLISDCYIEVGDDCIALKSGCEKLDHPRACEDVVVTNCVMKTPCCAVRLGYEGDAPIRNCVFSNLTMTETRTGINMLVPRHESVRIMHGPAIENISFSNIVMDLVCPFFLWVGDDAAAPGRIRNVSFSNIQGKARRASFFGGSRTLPLENIRLSSIDLEIGGEMDNEFATQIPDPYRVWDYYNKKGIPHGLFFRRVKDLQLENVNVRWGEKSGPWQKLIEMEEVTLRGK